MVSKDSRQVASPQEEIRYRKMKQLDLKEAREPGGRAIIQVS